MRRISPFLALAMMGGLGLASHIAISERNRRYIKPTIKKLEKESRQVRRARERRIK